MAPHNFILDEKLLMNVKEVGSCAAYPIITPKNMIINIYVVSLFPFIFKSHYNRHGKITIMLKSPQ